MMLEHANTVPVTWQATRAWKMRRTGERPRLFGGEEAPR